MRFILKLVLKVVAVSFALAFTILTALLTFVLVVSSVFLGIASGLVFLAAIVLFIVGEPLGGAAYLVVAFLVSPMGIPALAGKAVGLLGSAGGALRGFISS
jgi:hypothetical protein